MAECGDLQHKGEDPVIVEGTALAAELRRRRLGRATLHSSLTRTSSSAWVPGDRLGEAPSELLMLAALSLAETVPSPMSALASEPPESSQSA